MRYMHVAMTGSCYSMSHASWGFCFPVNWARDYFLRKRPVNYFYIQLILLVVKVYLHCLFGCKAQVQVQAAIIPHLTICRNNR